MPSISLRFERSFYYQVDLALYHWYNVNEELKFSDNRVSYREFPVLLFYDFIILSLKYRYFPYKHWYCLKALESTNSNATVLLQSPRTFLLSWILHRHFCDCNSTYSRHQAPLFIEFSAEKPADLNNMRLDIIFPRQTEVLCIAEKFTLCFHFKYFLSYYSSENKVLYVKVCLSIAIPLFL